MKVKVIEVTNSDSLEKEINEFITNKKIIDIKYQTTVYMFNYPNFLFTALITYEENK